MNKKHLSTLFIVLNLAFSFSAIYYVIDHFSHAMPNTIRKKSNQRFGKLMRNLPVISAKPEVTTLFLGTSIFQYFLYPPDFDKPLNDAGIESVSYNLAFEGNFGLGLYALNNRLMGEFSKNQKKFKAVIIEICPASMNRRTFNRHKLMIDVGNPDVFMNKAAWKDMFIADPATATYLFLNSHMPAFDWQYLEAYAFIQGRIYSFERKPRFAGIANIWSLPQFYERPEWNLEKFGMSGWNLPTSQIEFDQMQNKMHEPDEWKAMLADYFRGNGLNENGGFMGYEESLINYYIESVKLAQKFADNVYLLKVPYAPDFQQLADKFSYEDYVLNKVAAQTSATVIDYTKSFDFKDADFADAMHLRQESMKQVMTKLAHDLKDRYK